MKFKTKLIMGVVIFLIVAISFDRYFHPLNIIKKELGLNNTHTKTKAKIKLVFWHAMGGPLGKVMVDLVNKFNATHPNIYIKQQFMGNYDILIQKLISSVISNSQPDIAQVYESWTSQLKGGSAILPLDNFVKNTPNFNINDFFSVLLKDNLYDGKLLSLPFNKSIPVLYYNKDMFRDAGLNPEKPPRTWVEFREYCKKLTRDVNGDGIIDTYGAAFTPNAWVFECMVVQYGGQLLSKDNKKSLIASEAGIKSIQFWNDLINKYKCAYRTTGYNNQSDFVARKVGMVIGSVTSRFFMKGDITFDMGMAPLPIWKYNKTVLSGTNIAILNSNNPAKHKAAWEFLNWLTQTPQAAEWSTRTPYLPVRKSVLQTESWKKYVKEEPRVPMIIKQMANAIYEPRIGAWYSCRMLLMAAIEKVLLGYPASQVLQETAHKMDEKLKH
jgi:multiple sugar transport system substrate-binding protein